LGRITGTWQGDFEAGQAYFDEAMPIARELDDKPALAFILRQLGNMATHGDDLDSAQAYLEESVELAREIGDMEAVAAGVNSVGNVATLRGDYAKGIEIYEESLEQARQFNNRGMQSMTLINISANQRSLKQYNEATRSAQQALKFALESGSDYLISGGHAQVGFAHLQDNQDAEAREHLMKSLSTSRSMGSISGILQVIPGFAGLRAHQDNVNTALEWVGLVKSHPDVDSDGKLEIRRALEELGGELSPDEIEAAMERGSKLKLEAVLAEIEGE
jgi:tetratricopeptide (TPR) repeat protein